MVESRRPGFTVEWRIKKGFLNSVTFSTFHSYEFFLEDLQNTSWDLKFRILNYLSVWIKRSESDAGPEKLDMECDFDLLLVQKEPVAPRSLRGDEPPAKVEMISCERVHESEVVDLVPWSAIDDLRDEDVLLLRCRIWPHHSSFLQPVRHLVRSDGGCPECFTWRVSDFSALQRGNRIKYVLKKKDKDVEKTAFGLFVDDGESDIIYILQTSRAQVYSIRGLWVLDGRGGKTPCLKNDHPFESYTSGLMRVRKSELLKEKEKFLPNDQLTLYFEVRRVNLHGYLEKMIVGDPLPDDEGITGTPNVTREGGLTLTTPSPSVTKQLPTYNATNLPLNSSMACDMYRLFLGGELTDFELRVGSESVRVHKAVLAARSPVFLAMMTTQMRESSEQGVDIKDLEMDTVKNLLAFIYSDSVPDLDCTSVINLYAAAEKYDVMCLRKKCSDILKSNLCIQNLCPILSLADTYTDDDMKEFVMEFILQNWNDVIPSPEWENFLNEEMPLASRVMLFVSKKRIGTK